MAPLSKVRHSRKHMVQISGKRSIDQVNRDWRKIYDPNKRQCIRDTPTSLDDDVEERPRKSCLKRKSDDADPEDGHDRRKKRVKIPKPENPDVREFTKDGDPEFDFDLNQIFKGPRGPAFKKASDPTPKPKGRRQHFGAESEVTSIPGLGRKLSRLEQLPAEVLQPTLRHLLGDRTLHIALGRGWKKNSLLAPRCYVVCRNPNVEDLARLHKSYVPHKQCHEACYGDLGPSKTHDSDFDGKLHLSILRASPLLYREGSAILWTSNKFAFKNPQVFTDFLKCVEPAKSIRKLELSDELPEVASRSGTWNRIIQQDEALLEWGLQGRNSLILDVLKSVEHLELHFHIPDHGWTFADLSLRTEPPKYDEGLHECICSAFGDLRALKNVRTVQTYASMQIMPVSCSCIALGKWDIDHLHAHRILRVEESFNSEVRSVLGPELIQNEEDLREQRRQIFRLRTEATEREKSVHYEYEHLEVLRQNEWNARALLLDENDANMKQGLSARSRARHAVVYEYELAYSLANERLNKKKADELDKESETINMLMAEADKRLKKLEKRWGRKAGEGLHQEAFQKSEFGVGLS